MASRSNRSRLILLTLAIAAISFAPSRSEAQPRVRLSGFVRSAATGELVRSALISQSALQTQSSTNADGFFFIQLPSGPNRIRVRAIGFAPFDTLLTLDRDTPITLYLAPVDVTLSAVTVQGSTEERPDLDPRLPDMGVVRLDLAAVRKAPTVLGEADPLRSLTLLPGVSTTSDASTAFSVRGGSTDQNLILLDESTIYNPSHILGFLSTFNADAVDDVTLYKGSPPVRYGGRTASVVDIRQREGNRNEFVGSASIGLLASRLLLEGPLPAARGSWMLASRRSYADVFLKFATDTAVRNNTAYFYDLNGKANLLIGSQGSVMASAFLGQDRFVPGSNFGVGWGNAAGTLRWNQAFANRLFSKVSMTRSRYRYELEFPLGNSDSLTWNAGIGSTELRADERWHLTDRNVIEFGAEFAQQAFDPGSVTVRGAGALEPFKIAERNTRSFSVWLGQDVEVGARLAFRYGVRYARFERRGAGTVFVYQNNQPVLYDATLDRYSPATPIDSINVARNVSISNYDGWEPRASMRITLTDASSLKLSYGRTQQFLQLASNTNSPTPLDVWEPIGPFIKPQVADQYALGYSASLNGIETSAEVYVRRAQNVVDFIDGADVVLNPRLETVMVQGEGRAAGFELLMRRVRGSTTGWISYTLARAEQRFLAPEGGDRSVARGINGGDWFRSPFDKTHTLNVVALRPWGDKWTFGSTFTLSSGLPTTFPVSRYFVDGLQLVEYGARNSSRLPIYHRLDFSASRTLGRGELQFGVLNAYNRFNAQSLSFRQQIANPSMSEAVQLSIFGILPSINYSFRF